MTQNHNEAQQSPAEQTAVTAPSVVPGQGYPAGRDEKSPQPTGWQASGSHSTAPGATGTLEKVSRGTSE
jgi:hypothetical protein